MMLALNNMNNQDISRIAVMKIHSGRQSSLWLPHNTLCAGNKTLTRQNVKIIHMESYFIVTYAIRAAFGWNVAHTVHVCGVQ